MSIPFIIVRTTVYDGLKKNLRITKANNKKLMQLYSDATDELILKENELRAARTVTELYRKEALAADKERLKKVAELKLLRERVCELESEVDRAGGSGEDTSVHGEESSGLV